MFKFCNGFKYHSVQIYMKFKFSIPLKYQNLMFEGLFYLFDNIGSWKLCHIALIRLDLEYLNKRIESRKTNGDAPSRLIEYYC